MGEGASQYQFSPADFESIEEAKRMPLPKGERLSDAATAGPGRRLDKDGVRRDLALALSAIKVHQIETTVVHADTTSISVAGEYEQ